MSCKIWFWKFFKNSVKLLTSSFLVMLQTFFTQRTLKWKYGSPRALEGHLGTQALEWAHGHSRNWGTKALENLRSLGTYWALGYSGTWALGINLVNLVCSLVYVSHKMHFIAFNRKGRNEIFGFFVWGTQNGGTNLGWNYDISKKCS